MFNCIAVSERGLLATGSEDFYKAISLKERYFRMVSHFGTSPAETIADAIYIACRDRSGMTGDYESRPWETEEGFCFELRHLESESDEPVVCYVKHQEIIFYGKKAPVMFLETWNSLSLRDHVMVRSTPELLYLFLLDLYSRLNAEINSHTGVSMLQLKRELLALAVWLKDESKKYGALCEAQYANLNRLMLN